jgi:hypothetical protein
MIVKPLESNCKMMKSGKKSMKKSIKKQNINKIKWDHQNPQVVSCQILNIKKNIELNDKIKKKNQIHKKIQTIKKTKKINFQRT